MMEEKWTVYWNEYSSDTYLYGSEINYHKLDDVEFKNELVPSGTILKQWYSKTNYQRQRIEPALPMIDGESRYQIMVNIGCLENEAWLVRLVFFDKYDVEIEDFFIRDKVAEFKCPLKTYSYRLQLVNGGMTWFHFHSIVIREMDDETDEKTEKIKQNRASDKKIWRKNVKFVRRRTGTSDSGI